MGWEGQEENICQEALKEQYRFISKYQRSMAFYKSIIFLKSSFKIFHSPWIERLDTVRTDLGIIQIIYIILNYERNK